MESYILLKSDECKELFNENRPCSFKIQLPFPLIMEGRWEIALTEINIAGSSNVHNELLVCSNIVKESIYNESQMNLLRRIVTSSKDLQNYCFCQPYYIPVATKSTQTISVDIMTTLREFALFLTEPVTVVLHLRKALF